MHFFSIHGKSINSEVNTFRLISIIVGFKNTSHCFHVNFNLSISKEQWHYPLDFLKLDSKMLSVIYLQDNSGNLYLVQDLDWLQSHRSSAAKSLQNSAL